MATPDWIEDLQEPEKSCAFMQRPHLWLYLILPLKQPKTRDKFGLPETGFLVARNDGDHGYCSVPEVFIGNIFLVEEAMKLPPRVYSNFEALCADGWVVD